MEVKTGDEKFMAITSANVVNGAQGDVINLLYVGYHAPTDACF